jgi:hypothetical protein
VVCCPFHLIILMASARFWSIQLYEAPPDGRFPPRAFLAELNKLLEKADYETVFELIRIRSGSGIFGYINYLVEKDRKYILDTLVNGKCGVGRESIENQDVDTF